jgi:AbiV family abortive infection protein
MEDFFEGFDQGPIPDEEVALGMHFSFVNAQQLYQEANLLREQNHRARAISLAILCLEELGRIPVLLNAVRIGRDDKDMWKRFWKRMRSHKFKMGLWSVYGKGLERNGSEDARFYSDRIPTNSEDFYDRWKQCGFYVSFAKGKAVLPDTIAGDNPHLLDDLFRMTENRIQGFKSLHETIVGSRWMVEEVIRQREGWKTDPVRRAENDADLRACFED